MEIQKFNHRGTEINKIAFSEIEFDLEGKGLDVDSVFMQIANEKEYIFVSNGFVNALEREENVSANEWHHYFIKESDGHFRAEKLNFN